jgi:hypothetical protein
VGPDFDNLGECWHYAVARQRGGGANRAHFQPPLPRAHLLGPERMARVDEEEVRVCPEGGLVFLSRI